MFRVIRPVGRPRWAGLFATMAVVLTLGTWAAPIDSSGAQAPKPYRVEVSKFTDLVSGETVEINLRTDPGTIVYPGAPSQVFTCRYADEYTVDDLSNGTCISIGAQLNPDDDSVDADRFRRYPDEGPEQGRRAISILRPGVGVAEWRLGGVDYSLACGPTDRCRFVYRIRVQTGSEAPTDEIEAGPELQYRPVQGIAGCEGQSPDVVTSAIPDRMQDAWLGWTRDVCQSAGSAPPTSAFFEPEGHALDSFATGEVDLSYGAVGYRPGFDPPVRRPMVPVPIGLNAVVVAVGGGYPVVDGTWPTDLPKPHEQFRLTNEHLAILFGQWEQALMFSDRVDEVLANNPQIPGPNYLLNSNAGQALAVTGPQSTTLFASTHFDALAPDQWTNIAGAPRGIETDFNAAQPPHQVGEMDLKTGRPDLARIVYRELYSQGTYYVLTDLATANALGLTVVTIPNASGEWVTPTAETLAAAVPQMHEQDDGTLVPNPTTTAGYPLTYVEYAMAPAEPLVTSTCEPRPGSQELMTGWLTYVTGDGQGLLPPELGGLVPLTPALRSDATDAVDQVGASPVNCTAPPTTSTPPTTLNTGGAPGSAFGPDGGNASRPGSSSPAGGPASPDGVTRPADEDTVQAALDAAEDDDVELPGLTGIRAIDEIWSPVALVAIVALTTGLALGMAGYRAPDGVRRASARAWSRAKGGVRRLRQIRLAREAST